MLQRTLVDVIVRDHCGKSAHIHALDRTHNSSGALSGGKKGGAFSLCALTFFPSRKKYMHIMLARSLRMAIATWESAFQVKRS